MNTDKGQGKPSCPLSALKKPSLLMIIENEYRMNISSNIRGYLHEHAHQLLSRTETIELSKSAIAGRFRTSRLLVYIRGDEKMTNEELNTALYQRMHEERVNESKHRAKLAEWKQRIMECRSSGKGVMECRRSREWNR